MSEGAATRGRRPPAFFYLVVAGAFGVGAWLLLQSFTSPAVKECRDLYRAARTPTDTARVDSTTPQTGADPHSCGFIRQSARWSDARRS